MQTIESIVERRVNKAFYRPCPLYDINISNHQETLYSTISNAN